MVPGGLVPPSPLPPPTACPLPLSSPALNLCACACVHVYIDSLWVGVYYCNNGPRFAGLQNGLSSSVPPIVSYSNRYGETRNTYHA